MLSCKRFQTATPCRLSAGCILYFESWGNQTVSSKTAAVRLGCLALCKHSHVICRYLTYHNHCWIFRELMTGRRMNIDNSQVPRVVTACLIGCSQLPDMQYAAQAVFAKKESTQTVHIQAPPLLTWMVRLLHPCSHSINMLRFVSLNAVLISLHKQRSVYAGGPSSWIP